MKRGLTRRHVVKTGLALGASALAAQPILSYGQDKEPIKIGFSLPLTGKLAANGKQALIASEIWAEDVNAKGGLLGRPVKLVYYDDQSNATNVPSIAAKLLDIDKCEIVLPGYSTALTVPFMPTAIQRGLLAISLLSLAVNEKFHYPNYFCMGPYGPDPKRAFSEGYFDAALTMTPKPKTVAIVYADQEFSNGAAQGARENAKAMGFKIVYDHSYPGSTVDFASIIRTVQAADPDFVYLASYPTDGVGLIRAAHELGIKTGMFGGGMVGMQSTALKTQLGPLLNGLVYHDFWVPGMRGAFPGVQEFLAKYQARAGGAHIDALGYYVPPMAYARMQALQQAIEGTGTLDHQKLGAWLHANTLHTVVGDIKFGPLGEWSRSRILFVQYQNVKGHDVAQFKRPDVYAVLAPDAYKSAGAKLVYPYEKAWG